MSGQRSDQAQDGDQPGVLTEDASVCPSSAIEFRREPGDRCGVCLRDVHGPVDGVVDAGSLVDPATLLASDLDQVAPGDQSFDGGVGRRPCHAEQLLGATGGEDRGGEEVLGQPDDRVRTAFLKELVPVAGAVPRRSGSLRCVS